MDSKRMNRRDFLKFASMAAAAALATACQKTEPTATPTTAAQATAVPTTMPTPKPAQATPEPTKAPTATPTRAATSRPAVLTFIGPNISTLDSYLYTGGMYGQVFLGLKEGLVEFDQNIGVQMAQAESFTVSNDALEYTFLLRKDNQWYDGTPVTAHDYVTAIHYQMQPGQESKYGWDSPFGALLNGNEFRNGAAAAEDVGANALDDFTLTFQLARPVPDFINALVTGSCYPIQTASYEAHGVDWHLLENFQGNGPYMISNWVLNEYIEIVPNPTYNRERGNLERVKMLFSGKPLEAYEANEIDFGGTGGVAGIVVAQNDAVLSKELRFVPTSGLEWLRPLRSEDGFLYDHPEVFYAMIKGTDVAKLVDPIFMGTKAVVYQMYPDVQPGFKPMYDEINQPDVAAAQKILADAGFPNGQGVPKLKLTFPSYQNEDYISAWTAISAEVQDNLGITLELNNLESGIYSQVVYDALNPASEAGVGFYASGKPWGTPTFGFDFTGDLNRYKDSATYNEYAALVKETNEIRQQLKVIEGGSDSDFDKLVAEIQSLGQEAMALNESHGASARMKADAQKLYDGWVQSVQDGKGAIKSDADRAKQWSDANAALWQAKMTVYDLTNLRDEIWQIDLWRDEALSTTDVEKQIALGIKAYEIVLNNHTHLPLWLAVSVNLVRPYVKGLVQNPYWWGNVMYMKWVSIE